MMRRSAIMFLPLMSTIFRLNVTVNGFCHHHDIPRAMMRRHNNNNMIMHIIDFSCNRNGGSWGNRIGETCVPRMVGLAIHGSTSTRLFTMALGGSSSSRSGNIGYWQSSNSKASFLGKRFISTRAGSSSSLTRRFSSRGGGGASNNSNVGNTSNNRRERRPNNRRSSPPPPPIPLPGQAGRGNFRELVNVGGTVFVIKKEHQRSGIETQGSVMRLLTKSPHHPRGIKVMLATGEVGRVTRIVDGEDNGPLV